MPYVVHNLRKGRPVVDHASLITLRGKQTISDEDMAKLKKNPVVAALLGFDEKGEPQGTALMSVTKVEPPAKKPKKAS